MTDGIRFALSRSTNERAVREALEKAFALEEDLPVSRRETYLDTFDWRLFRNSLTLSFDGGGLVLRAQPGGETVQAARASSAPVFAADVAGGAMRERLSETIGVRALLALVEAERETTVARVLDRRGKTVARVEFEKVEMVSESVAAPPSRYVWLRPVTGCEEHFDYLERRLGQLGCVAAGGDSFANLLEAAGKRPGDYSSKLDFDLDPGISAYDALVLIFRFLAAVMRSNEEGIRKDVDTEFLHDFRVATRRTRAGLGQIKMVFPRGVRGKFRHEFADFGEMTNRLRDLDVYLLNVEVYRELLPPERRGDIETLFDRIRAERAREFEKVRTWLGSAAYLEPLAAWEKVLAEPLDDAKARANSRVRVVEVAGKTIRKRYRVVVASGREAVANPDDATLHRLRIECKKLRYLLEFFSSLYPSHTIEGFVAQLKALQDNLGRQQDIVVQKAGLRRYAAELSLDGGRAAEANAAAEVLVGALEAEKTARRRDFAGVFEGFVSEENARVLRKLCEDPRRAARAGDPGESGVRSSPPPDGMTGEGRISESAFLVNESRARNVPLSRDTYASLWVTDGTRRLWEDFSRDVYLHDDVELALRNRFYLEVLETNIRRDSAVVFVNLAAGFTSYPFLTEKPCRSIEVDFDHVCRFKRLKIEEWRRRGAVPLRDVEYLACDLSDENDLGSLSARLRGELGSARSVVFLEGITYYLERRVLLGLFELLAGIQHPGSVVALDFWSPDFENHPVHARFRKFFADRFGRVASEYNLFEEGLLRSLGGYEVVELTDIVELEKRFSAERRLADPREILPERYAVLERRERI